MANAQQPGNHAQKNTAQQGNGAIPRILRIGIVLGGNIIEERLVRNRETITIGQSANNSFSVPIDGLPMSFPVFALENDRYFLNVTDNMDGRISAGGSVQTIAQLRQSGAQKKGDRWVIALDERSRGKITVGAMTLLFQFVTAPPIQPRPRLPASVRGTLADRIEPQLAIILGLSILVHFSVAIWAHTRDSVIERPIEKIARSFSVGQYEPPEKIEPVVDDTEDQGEDETTEKPAGKTDEKPQPRAEKPQPEDTGGGAQDDDDDGGEAPSDTAIEETINKTAVVAVLNTIGGSGNGLFGEMSDTDQRAGLDSAIAHAKGKKTSTTGGGKDRQRGQNNGKLGSDKGTRVGGPSGGGNAGGNKTEERVSRVKLGSADDLSLSDLDPSAVVKRIRGKYLAGIKRCHQRVLKADPKAQGRVTIRFTVGPTGKVTKATVNGFDPTVDACIRGQASKWRFGAPKDDGKPTSADFSVPLLLKPGA